jgi:hypothetical protein
MLNASDGTPLFPTATSTSVYVAESTDQTPPLRERAEVPIGLALLAPAGCQQGAASE